jgi:PTS system mannose-specific IIC component
MSVWPLVLAQLLVWGTVAGVDLVSAPQFLLSRPLVAAGVAGLILGDVAAGIQVGLLLELFALDVLPIGAVRYPDYGPAAVGATLAAAGRPWEEALGVSAIVGLVVGALGGWTLEWVRHANDGALRRVESAIAAGDPKAIRALQLGGLVRDAARSLALTAIALVAAWAARHVALERATGELLTTVLVGAGLAAAVNGVMRSAGHGVRRWWLAGGLIGGLLVAAVLR